MAKRIWFRGNGYPETLAPVECPGRFHATPTLTGNFPAFSYPLRNPPMIITWTAHPPEMTDLKYTLNQEANKRTSDGKLPKRYPVGRRAGLR